MRQHDSSILVGMATALTHNELETWRGFRFMVEETSLGVSRALSSSTGMSGGQFGILSILQDAPPKGLRQQELADAMRWDRTRLSHQLTRMQARHWVTRKKAERGGTLVLITKMGRDKLTRVSPILGQIVREHFLSRLTESQLAALQEIRAALAVRGPAL